MEISPPFFYLFAGLATAFSLFVVFSPRVVTGAFALVMTFLSFAGIYAFLGAHLIAGLQVFIYAGAVMVLFVFVIMLLNANRETLDFRGKSALMKVAAVVVALGGFLLFLWVVRHSALPEGNGAFTPERIDAAGGNTRVVSELLFSDYLLPFELTSVALLAAIVASVAIAKRHRKTNGGNPHAR